MAALNISLKELESIDKEVQKFPEKRRHKAMTLRAAVYYASRGIAILPIRPYTKWLDHKGGMNYQSASKNLDLVEKWFGPGGEYEGWNIGIACGREGGVFAVDVDTHGGDGYQTLIGLGMNPDEIIAPTQSTPSGGRHYLFAWEENARSSTNTFGGDGVKSGIDTRGGTATASKGHIMVWPSVVEQDDGSPGCYEWTRGGIVREVPKVIMDRLGESWGMESKAKKGNGRGNENVGADDAEKSYTIHQIGNMIGHIDINDLDYDRWLYIGQAINSQHPGKEGLELWDAWSQTGERYVPNECYGRWHSFEPKGPIRIGTLIAIAANYGYRPETQGMDIVGKNEDGNDDFKSIIDEYNEKFAIVKIGGSVKIMMENPISLNNVMADRFSLMDKNGFRLLMANDVIIAANARGDLKSVAKSDIWLAEEDRRTFEGGILFMPGKPKEFNNTFNMWRGWEVESIEGNWELFKAHIRDNVCRGDDEHFSWILDWMADIVQNPMNPKGTCIVMHGIEGCGKGTFVHLFGKLFGRHYKHVTNEEHFTGRFNGHLQDSLLTFADEITYGGSKKTAGVLKAMVTEPTLVTERKGVDAVHNPNHMRMVISSNEDWFIPAGPQSRRWFVLDVGGAKANDEKYFGAMRDQMDDGGYEGMFHELQHRDIKSNLRQAPVTGALEEQRTLLQSQKGNHWNFFMEIYESGNIDPGLMVNGIHEKGVVVIVTVNKEFLKPAIVRAKLYEEYKKWFERQNFDKNTSRTVDTIFKKDARKIFEGIPVNESDKDKKVWRKRSNTLVGTSNRLPVYVVPDRATVGNRINEALGTDSLVVDSGKWHITSGLDNELLTPEKLLADERFDSDSFAFELAGSAASAVEQSVLGRGITEKDLKEF